MNSHIEVLRYLPSKVAFSLSALGKAFYAADEIRLRTDRPLSVCIGGNIKFINAKGCFCRRDEALFLSREDMNELIRMLTQSSRFRLDEEIKNGFIPFGDGMRAGVCGVCRVKDGNVITISDITSVNIRLNRRFDMFAREICEIYSAYGVSSTLVCGAPACGKTTYLKSIIYLLSTGCVGRPLKVAVADSRYELVCGGIEKLDIDVISGCDKAYALMLLTRVMNPDVIICDEIDGKDSEAMLYCMGAGVPVIASVHAPDADGSLARPFVRSLHEKGLFDTFVTLSRENGLFCAEVKK